jgi:hypothetical protein
VGIARGGGEGGEEEDERDGFFHGWTPILGREAGEV